MNVCRIGRKPEIKAEGEANVTVDDGVCANSTSGEAWTVILLDAEPGVVGDITGNPRKDLCLSAWCVVYCDYTKLRGPFDI